MLKVEMKRTECDCHPETCCHADYRIYVEGVKVAEGNDPQQMERLTLLAQIGAQDLELRRLAKAQAEGI